MPRIRLCCIISIFLCVQCSTEARGQVPETSDSLSLMVRALEYEKLAYLAESTADMNDALIRKAECYAGVSAWTDALSSLERVRMYALGSEELQAVLLSREKYAFLAGENALAAGSFDELLAMDLNPGESDDHGLLLHALVLAGNGRFDESRELAQTLLGRISARGESLSGRSLEKIYSTFGKHKSPDLALALSFFPPLGHIYAGRASEGFLSMAMNAGTAAFAVWQLLGKFYVTGGLGGAIALERTFMGGQQRVLELIDAYPEQAASDAVRELSSFFSPYVVL